MQTHGHGGGRNLSSNTRTFPGLIYTGYNGQAQGTAMAKILFGEVQSGGQEQCDLVSLCE